MTFGLTRKLRSDLLWSFFHAVSSRISGPRQPLHLPRAEPPESTADQLSSAAELCSGPCLEFILPSQDCREKFQFYSQHLVCIWLQNKGSIHTTHADFSLHCRTASTKTHLDRVLIPVALKLSLNLLASPVLPRSSVSRKLQSGKIPLQLKWSILKKEGVEMQPAWSHWWFHALSCAHLHTQLRARSCAGNEPQLLEGALLSSVQGKWIDKRHQIEVRSFPPT